MECLGMESKMERFNQDPPSYSQVCWCEFRKRSAAVGIGNDGQKGKLQRSQMLQTAIIGPSKPKDLRSQTPPYQGLTDPSTSGSRSIWGIWVAQIP